MLTVDGQHFDTTDAARQVIFSNYRTAWANQRFVEWKLDGPMGLGVVDDTTLQSFNSDDFDAMQLTDVDAWDLFRNATGAEDFYNLCADGDPALPIEDVPGTVTLQWGEAAPIELGWTKAFDALKEADTAALEAGQELSKVIDEQILAETGPDSITFTNLENGKTWVAGDMRREAVVAVYTEIDSINKVKGFHTEYHRQKRQLQNPELAQLMALAEMLGLDLDELV